MARARIVALSDHRHAARLRQSVVRPTRIRRFRATHPENRSALTDNGHRSGGEEHRRLTLHSIRYDDGGRICGPFEWASVPVCSPDYLARRGPLRTIDDLVRDPARCNVERVLGESWGQWFQMAGIRPPETLRRASSTLRGDDRGGRRWWRRGSSPRSNRRTTTDPPSVLAPTHFAFSAGRSPSINLPSTHRTATGRNLE